MEQTPKDVLSYIISFCKEDVFKIRLVNKAFLVASWPHIDPSSNDNAPLRLSILNGDSYLFDMFMDDKVHKMDLTKNNSIALACAAVKGDAKMVSKLIEYAKASRSELNIDRALKQAVKFGHDTVVATILKEYKPKDAEEILICSFKMNFIEVVKEILSVIDIRTHKLQLFEKLWKIIFKSGSVGLYDQFTKKHNLPHLGHGPWVEKMMTIASGQGHSNLIERVLKDLGDSIYSFYPSMKLACLNGHTNVISVFMSNKNVVDSINLVHLVKVAIKSGNKEIFDCVIKTVKEKSKIIDYEKSFIAACTFNKLHCFRTLFTISNGIFYADEQIMMIVCSNGFCELLTDMLRNGCNPTINKNDPIIVASEKGHEGIVKLLLQDIRVNPSDQHNKALYKACQNGHTSIVKQILDNKKFDPCDESDSNPIDIACRKGHLDIVKLLVESEPIRVWMNHGSPIEAAFDGGNKGVIDYLLWDSKMSLYVDFNIKKLFSDACSRGNIDRVQMLLPHPIIKGITSKDNDTTLWEAILHRQVEVVKILLKNHFFHEDQIQRYLSVVLCYSSERIFELLLKYTAKNATTHKVVVALLNKKMGMALKVVGKRGDKYSTASMEKIHEILENTNRHEPKTFSSCNTEDSSIDEESSSSDESESESENELKRSRSSDSSDSDEERSKKQQKTS